MKINSILQKLEASHINIPSKKQFQQQVSKGDFVSIIYYDVEKEQTQLQQFTGICTKFKSKGLNTKIHVRNVLEQIVVEQQFFFFSQSVLDVAILRKKCNK